MTQRIKTNIKFYKGLDNVENKVYGFVTKVKGSWKGCRETDKRKKIVFVDTAVSKDIIPNALYSCTLVPMREKNGFIVTSANLVKFKGTIITQCRNKQYTVIIKFGNKEIVYNPASLAERERSIPMIANLLRCCVDLENSQDVAEDFISTACLVKKLSEKDV